MAAHKVALVTGGARGLGLAIADTLLSRGLKVCIGDVLEEAGQAAAATLAAKHGTDAVCFVCCDVTKQEQFNNAWAQCEESLGKLDLLINNAGIGDEKNWKKTVDVNLGGCITGTLLAMEKMNTAEGGTGGCVVNIASIAGVSALPFGPIYSASKAGIVGFSRSVGHPLHLSLTGVKVQCLCPALIQTDFAKTAMATPFSESILKAMTKFAGALETMPTEEVTAALMKLIDEGPPGGVMVVEPAKEPYYVQTDVGKKTT